MEELKQDLQVEDGQGVFFIQGNFQTYFQEQEILGEGASGTVKRCIKNETDEVYAVKIMRYRGDTELLSLVSLNYVSVEIFSSKSKSSKTTKNSTINLLLKFMSST